MTSPHMIIYLIDNMLHTDLCSVFRKISFSSIKAGSAIYLTALSFALRGKCEFKNVHAQRIPYYKSTGFLSTTLTLLSVVPVILSVALISIHHFDSSFRRLDDSFRHFGNSIRRSDFYPSLWLFFPSLGRLFPSLRQFYPSL
ncbi:hypothetical protein [Lysinibacillus sp. NPDC056185]|uniref:hypothetical protein n=1 Tax=Lysinibacillus sp. NPDC056185 TaxID=3345739 RepID=UPI0039EF5C57